MGDPRKPRKKSKGPSHPWNKLRIEEEKRLKVDYGLKNKSEIWKAQSDLKRITAQAKRLIRDKKHSQAQKETEQLLQRLEKLGLISKGTPVEDILALQVTDILDRRLQSIVFKFKLAGTIKQARQFISHGHVYVNGKKMDVPSYAVCIEDKIEYNPRSQFNDAENPEMVKLTNKDKVEVKTTVPEKKEEVVEEKKNE